MTSHPRHRPRRIVVLAGLGLLCLGIGWAGLRLSVAWVHRRARHELASGAVGAAERWLDTARWLQPGSYETPLLAAAGRRLAGQVDRWAALVNEAQRLGAPRERLAIEAQLGLVRSGERADALRSGMGELLAAGVPMHDVIDAYLHGFLAQGSTGRARGLLEGWTSDAADHPYADYLWGAYWQSLANLDEARSRFEHAVERAPRHELALRALAEIHLARSRFDLALAVYAATPPDFHAAEFTVLGHTRALRMAGQWDAAERRLLDLTAPLALAEYSHAVQIELGQLALDRGDYEQAERWLSPPRIEEWTDQAALAAAAVTLTLKQEPVRAARLLDRLENLRTGEQQRYEQSLRRALGQDARRGPGDQPANDSEMTAPTPHRGAGHELYVQHCAACHGQRGDGQGRAARHLFPRPRDFRHDAFRIVSTYSGRPTHQDVAAVVRRGLPGTSMPAFPLLRDTEVDALVEIVLQFRREGWRKRWEEQGEAGELTSAAIASLAAFASQSSAASESEDQIKIPVPWPATDAEAAVRGRAAYQRLGCHQCHDTEHEPKHFGDARPPVLFDERGEPTSPRDLSSEPFKGGLERESIYLRLVAGMPGTPHPAVTNLSEREIAELAEYCWQQSQRPRSTRTNSERARWASGLPDNSASAVTSHQNRAERDARAHDPVAARVRAFCGDCHALPRPESLTRDAWYEAVRKGFEFYAQSQRVDLTPPTPAEVYGYFRSRAPERITYPEPVESPEPSGAAPFGAAFRVEKLPRDPRVRVPPAVSQLRWQELTAGGPAHLLAAEMRTGRIAALQPEFGAETLRTLAQIDYPCRVVPCDLDGSGRLGFLVADLGSFSARDHRQGRIIWMRPTAASPGASVKPEFETVELVSALGRVADVRPADIDGDGRQDLVVAEFGFQRTGQILLLRNAGFEAGRPQFERRRLDPRPGAIHLPLADLDGDGQPDVAALWSQESESVELLIQRGAERFERHVVWQAPDLTFGSNGLVLVDLDGDGDLDLLLSNGDSFDNLFVSPWHGVQWLENRGEFQFTYHRLAELPGACGMVASDLDGDGDLDIVASAWLPSQFRPDTLDLSKAASVVLLEQVAPGRFTRHTLQRGFPHYAAIAAGDFNRDGANDFALGVHASDQAQPDHWLAIWWNAKSGSARPAREE